MYLEHYGLNRLPFQLTPDINFFFDSRAHKRALATITYGLSKNEGFVVVTGEVGAGKTTMIEYLLAHGDLGEVVPARISTTQLEAENLLELICHEFRLRRSGASKATYLRDLNSFFLRTAQSGKRALVIVDEVQNLSRGALEELRMLSNFQHREMPLVQLLLVGQPEFRKRLASPECEQIRQRVIASYHLAPLGPEDVPVYVEHRLTHAGWQGGELFSAAAFDRILEETRGVPRKINRLCDRLLLFGFLEGRDRIDLNAVEAVCSEMAAENLADVPGPASPSNAIVANRSAADRRPIRRFMRRVAAEAPQGEAAAGDRRDYVDLLSLLESLRGEISDYKIKMDRIMQLVAQEERRRGGPP